MQCLWGTAIMVALTLGSVTMAYTPLEPRDHQANLTACALDVANEWLLEQAGTSNIEACRPVLTAFAVKSMSNRSAGLQGCLHGLEPNPPKVAIYINADAQLPSHLHLLNAYKQLGRQAQVNLESTPTLNTSTDVVQVAARLWTDFDLIMRDEASYVAFGYNTYVTGIAGMGTNMGSMEKPTGLLSPRTYLMLFYRRDWFSQLNLQPPETWQDMAALAANTSLWKQIGSGSGTPAGTPADKQITGLCLDLARAGSGSYLLVAIWASLTQYLGMFQGLHFDPYTLMPLINTPSMHEAARIFLQLANHTDADSRDSMGPLPGAFLQGRCAMTVGWDFYMELTSGHPVSGKLGFSALPGSHMVWHRHAPHEAATELTIVPCQPPASGIQYDVDNEHGSDDDHLSVICPHAKVLPDGRVINKVQVSALLIETAIIPPDSDPWAQSEAVIVQAYLTRPKVRFAKARDNVTVRLLAEVAKWGSESSPGADDLNRVDLSDFLGQYPGVALSDAQQFFRALWSVKQQVNTAPELCMLNAAFARAMLFDAVQKLLDGGAQVVDQVLAATQAGYQMVWGLDATANQEIYLRSIDWNKRTDWGTSHNTSDPGSTGTNGQSWLVLSITLPALLAAFLGAVLIWRYAKRQATHNRTFLGHVKPPGVSASTSLLVTDIEDSTHLWENLDQEVMDRALTLHHGAIRVCLAKHHAYEVATEGDSFIISTHTALQAVELSIDIHDTMLQCEWPEELLQEYQCHQVWVTSRSSNSSADKQRGEALKSVTNAMQNNEQRKSRNSSRLWQVYAKVQHISRWLGHLSDHSVKGHALAERTPSQIMQITPSMDRDGGGPGCPDLPPGALASAFGSLTGEDDPAWNRRVEDGCPTVPGGSPIRRGLSIDIPTVEYENQASLKTRRSVSLHQRSASFQYGSLSPFLVGQARSSVATDTYSLPRSASKESEAGSRKSRSVLQHLERVVTILGHQPSEDMLQNGETYLLLSGFRIRMGIATGLDDPSHAVFDRSAGRMQYSGPKMDMARALGSACPGGQVLLADTTHQQLPLGALPQNITVAHMGEYLLKDVEGPVTVYAACRSTLIYRFILSTEMRCVRQLSAPFLDAPCKMAAVAFMYIVGVQSLLAWDTTVTAQSIQLIHNIFKNLLLSFGGYLMELPNGLCLASFPAANTAVKWALACCQLGLDADWPEALLGHELGEEVLVPVLNPDGNGEAPRPARRKPELRRSLTSRMLRQMTRSSMDGEEAFSAAMKLPSDTKNQQSNYILTSNLSVDSTNQEAASQQSTELPALKPELVFRGLRLKCGVDFGKVSASIHATSGRITCRGRVMNRASRVASAAKTGQVWCTESAWAHSQFKPLTCSRSPSIIGALETQTVLNAAPSVPLSVFRPSVATFFNSDGELDHTSVPDLPGHESQSCLLVKAPQEEDVAEVKRQGFSCTYPTADPASGHQFSEPGIPQRMRPILHTSGSYSGSKKQPGFGAKVSFKMKANFAATDALDPAQLPPSTADDLQVDFQPVGMHPEPDSPRLTASGPLFLTPIKQANPDEIKLHMNLLASPEAGLLDSHLNSAEATDLMRSQVINVSVPEFYEGSSSKPTALTHSVFSSTAGCDDDDAHMLKKRETVDTDEVVLSMALLVQASSRRRIAGEGLAMTQSLDLPSRPAARPPRIPANGSAAAHSFQAHDDPTSSQYSTLLGSTSAAKAPALDWHPTLGRDESGAAAIVQASASNPTDAHKLGDRFKERQMHAVQLGPIKLKGVMETVRVVHCVFR